MFEKNTHLLHVDLSFCGFSKQDCEMMNKGLSKNQTIMGIHMTGNDGSVSYLGYIVNKEDHDCAVESQISRISSQLVSGLH